MSDAAEWLAATLAERAGYDSRRPLVAPAPGDAATRWKTSGLAALTGPINGEPVLPKRDYASRLDALVRAVQAFAALFGRTAPSLSLDLFTERAADLGLSRRGQVSAGGIINSNLTAVAQDFGYRDQIHIRRIELLLNIFELVGLNNCND